MVRLPTREDLGALPSVRTGRAIPRIQVSIPDISVSSLAQARAARQRGESQISAVELVGASRKRLAASVLAEKQAALAEGLAGKGQAAIAEGRAAQIEGQAGEAVARGIQDLGQGFAQVAQAFQKRQ